MRGSRKIPLIPAPGGTAEDINPALIPDGKYLASSNWLIRRDVGRPRPGYERVGSAALADVNRVIGIGFRGSHDTESATVLHTTANAYQWTGSAFSSITGTWTASATNQHVRFTPFSTSGTLRLIRTNAANALDYWDGTGNFQDVGGTPPAARDITTTADRVVLFNVTSGGTNYPHRVQWSDSNDMATWGASNFADLSQTNDDIIAGQALGPLNMAIYKSHSLFLGTAQAALVPFQFQFIAAISGPVSPAALVVGEDAHYWLGVDNNIYRYDGTSLPRVVSAGLVSTLTTTVMQGSEDLIHGAFVHGDNESEVWWWIPRSSSTGVRLDRAVSFNTRTNAVHYHSFANSITAAHEWSRRATLSWEDLTGTWDNIANTYPTWDDMNSGSLITGILGDASGNIFRFGFGNNDNGTAIAWSFTHGWRLVAEDGEDFYLDGVASYWQQTTAALTVTGGVLVTTALADSSSDTEQTTTFDLSTNSNHQVTFADQRGKFARVRFAASSVVDNIRYRGGLLTGWPRKMA